MPNNSAQQNWNSSLLSLYIFKKSGRKLHRYICTKAANPYIFPQIFTGKHNKTTFTLFEIITIIVKTIRGEGLYDQNDPQTIICDCDLQKVLGKKRLQRRPQTREMEEDNAYEIVHHPIFVLQRMGKLLCSERNRDLSIKAISLYNRCTCMHTNGAIIKNLFNKMQFLVDQ